MSKAKQLTVYESSNGAFAAINEGTATVKNQYISVADTAETVTIPSGSGLVRLCADSDFWYALTGTALEPVDDTGVSVFLPAGLERYISLKTGDTLSVISNSIGNKINMLFWD